MNVTPIRPEKHRPFFTIKTLAEYVTLSERTVAELIAKGDVTSYKLAGARRIDPADVDAWLARHRTDAQTVRDSQRQPSPEVRRRPATHHR